MCWYSLVEKLLDLSVRLESVQLVMLFKTLEGVGQVLQIDSVGIFVTL